MSLRKLENRVAIITGAAGGIGSVGAGVFVREGARVVIADIDIAGGSAVERAIRECGGDALFIRTDVSDTIQVQAMASAVIERHGRIDVLWNNATAFRGCSEHDGPVHALPEHEWDFIQSVSLRGVYLCSKYVLPHMMAAGHGVIINTSSTDALIGVAGYDSYAAAKGGVNAMTRSMAAYYAKYGIRVNTICPGFVRTAASAPWVENPAIRPTVERVHLLGIGEPADIANFALYLASDDARWVTGGVYPIDGGLTSFKEHEPSGGTKTPG